MRGAVSDSIQRVGVVGLGRMGLPICARLCAAGFDVTATDARADLRTAATGAGARWSGRVDELAARVDLLVTILPGSAEVESVIDPVAGSGTLWLEMSSAAPRVARAIAARAIRALDAPVAGGPEAAREGELESFVGGDEDDLAAARPVLDRLARRIVHVGPRGAGYAAKLLANSLWFTQAVAVAEALAIAARCGLDPERMRATLEGSAAASRFIAHDAPALLAGDNLSTFALGRCCDQLDEVVAMAAEQLLPARLIGEVAGAHRRALERYGDVGGELLGARLVLDDAGVGPVQRDDSS